MEEERQRQIEGSSWFKDYRGICNADDKAATKATQKEVIGCIAVSTCAS